MTGRFDPAVADVRWQKRWEDERCFIADTNSGKPTINPANHTAGGTQVCGACSLGPHT